MQEQENKHTAESYFLVLMQELMKELHVHMMIGSFFVLLSVGLSIFRAEYLLVGVSMLSWIGLVGPYSILKKLVAEALTAEENCTFGRNSVLTAGVLATGTIKVIGLINLTIAASLTYQLMF